MRGVAVSSCALLAEWSLLLQLCVFTVAASSRGYSGRNSNRMSLVEYFETKIDGGDKLHLKWSRGSNNKRALDTALKDSLLIQGDVLLRRGFPATPVMALPPTRNQSLTFKQWLQKVAVSEKAIMIHFRTTEVVKPALQYLFEYKQLLNSPVVLRANVQRGIASIEEPVKPSLFVSEVSAVMPTATIALGWTKTAKTFLEEASPHRIRYSWRDVLDIMDYALELHQPVLFSVRASLASKSFPQLMWLLGLAESYGLLVWSEDGDVFHDWNGLVALKKFADPKRVFYDLRPEHAGTLLKTYNARSHRIVLGETAWDRKNWRVIEFINPRSILSTILLSDRSVALLGWPTAFLISEKPTTSWVEPQTVSGRLLFVAKGNLRNLNPAAETGLSIFLLPDVSDVKSPILKRLGGVQVFIGYDGRVFIQIQSRRRRAGEGASYLPKAISQMVKHDCYGFRLRDFGRMVELLVYATNCSGGDQSIPQQSWSRLLRLRVPRSFTKLQRHVLIQKTGDGVVDVVVEHLSHTNAASVLRNGASRAAQTLVLTYSIAVVLFASYM